jgi:hypothetical protein
LDRERYWQRNQVERLMNRRKQYRAVATRFDKLAALSGHHHRRRHLHLAPHLAPRQARPVTWRSGKQT